MPMTLCLDFDGVIHSYTSGWKGANVVSDPPVPGAFGFIRRAADNGFDVQVYSSRSGQPGGIEAMREWFREHDQYVTQEALPSILDIVSFPTSKPAAFITIDDRALTFDGNWPEIETLKSFKPWNKR